MRWGNNCAKWVYLISLGDYTKRKQNKTKQRLLRTPTAWEDSHAVKLKQQEHVHRKAKAKYPFYKQLYFISSVLQKRVLCYPAGI